MKLKISFQKIISHTFFKNFSTLFLGSVLSQLIAVGMMPILSRIYNQEAFGILATTQAAINIIYSIGIFGYHIPIVIEKDSNNVSYIFKICKIMIIIVSVITILVFYLPFEILLPYKYSEIIIGLGAGSLLMNLIYNQYLIRKKLFKVYSKLLLLKNVFILLFQFSFSYIASLYGLIIGQVAAYFVLNWCIRRKVKIEKVTLEKEKVIQILRRYIDFPKYFLPSNCIESFSSNLPILFLGYYYPLSTIGLLGLAYKIILQPINLVASNINSLVISEMAQRKNEERSIYPWYLKMFSLLFVLSLFIAFLLFFLSKPLFPIIFGTTWAGSADMAITLLPLFFALSIKTIGNATVRVFEKQKFMLFFTITSLAIRLSLLFILVRITDDILVILLLYSTITFITIFAEQFFLLYIVRKYDKNLAKCIEN